MKRYWPVAFALIVGLLLAIIAACAPAAAPTPTPAGPSAGAVGILTLDPATIAQTGRVVINGTGYKPGESVLIVLVGAVKGEDFIIGGEVANDGGAWSTQPQPGQESEQPATVPEAIPAGVYTVKATGSLGTVAIGALQVTPKPTPTPTRTPTPRPAPAP